MLFFWVVTQCGIVGGFGETVSTKQQQNISYDIRQRQNKSHESVHTTLNSLQKTQF